MKAWEVASVCDAPSSMGSMIAIQLSMRVCRHCRCARDRQDSHRAVRHVRFASACEHLGDQAF